MLLGLGGSWWRQYPTADIPFSMLAIGEALCNPKPMFLICSKLHVGMRDSANLSDTKKLLENYRIRETKFFASQQEQLDLGT